MEHGDKSSAGYWNIISRILPFVLSILFIPFFFEGASFIRLLFFTAILSISVYVLLKSRYYNAFIFSITLFLVSGLFPAFHCMLYKHDKDNYRLDEDFVKYNAKQERSDLVEYSDSNFIRNILRENENCLDSPLLTHYTCENLKLILEPRHRHPGLHTGTPPGESGLSIYDSSGRRISLGDFDSTHNLREYLLKYIHELNQTKGRITHSNHINDSDIWVESVSGFLFGDIKTVSSAAKFIRLVQLVVVFYFLSMISKFVDSNKWFDFKRKEPSN